MSAPAGVPCRSVSPSALPRSRRRVRRAPADIDARSDGAMVAMACPVQQSGRHPGSGLIPPTVISICRPAAAHDLKHDRTSCLGCSHPAPRGMTRADGEHEARGRPESVAVATPKTRSLSPLGHPHVGDCVGDEAQVRDRRALAARPMVSKRVQP
jgi:hypothetical protein